MTPTSPTPHASRRWERTSSISTTTNCPIDGLYIDDTSMGRKTTQRARRILDAHNPNSQIDSHSWSHFNWDAGMTPSAYCYMQNFPYYKRLWYGEGFHYDARPDLWLVEMSGIPFGLMSEMLGTGQPWRGMVFGEVARLGWGGEPRPLWQAMDEFGMAGSEMTGFWDAACPVKTHNPAVLASVYRKQGKTLVALASWSAKDESVRLSIDFKALGLDPAKATLTAMAMENLQPKASYQIADPVTIPPGKGLLLTLQP
ncbi:MAG: glycoside hydrolase domain-containing protein [Verrucomicrobiota bacterium]